MANFLIDYENVNFQGLKGINYLDEKDSLIIFYNHACRTLPREYIDIIKTKKIKLELYKLINASKNALDFYVAAECGAIASSQKGSIAIISKDKGYQAVRDFFSLKNPLLKIIRAENIANGILALQENNDRYENLQKDLELVDLEIEIAKIVEIRKFHEAIISAFGDTAWENEADKIISFVEKNKDESPKKLYTDALREFGREQGQEIYRIIKKTI